MTTRTSPAVKILVEAVRQIGAGIREHLKDQRSLSWKRIATKPAVAAAAPQPDARLRQTLLLMGFKEKQVDRAMASPEMHLAVDKPFDVQVRVAVRVLT